MKDTIYHHKILGEVKITDACRELNRTNPDKTSTFVEYEDETREVTKALIEEFCRIIIRTETPSENLKETTIETKPDDILVITRSSLQLPIFIHSGDIFNVKFKTENYPEDHTIQHEFMINKIKWCKQEQKPGIIFLEYPDRLSCEQWEFEWRKKI